MLKRKSLIKLSKSDKKKNVKVLKEKSEKIAKNTPSKAKDEPAANKTTAKKALKEDFS